RRHDVAGLHVLPGLHGPRLDDACYGRAHGRVAQVELRGLQGLDGHLSIGLRRQTLRAVRRDLLARDEAGRLLARALAPRGHGLAVVRLGVRFVERRLRAVARQAVALGVDHDERVAALDLLPLGERHAIDGARHARGDLYALERVDRAGRVHDVR